MAQHFTAAQLREIEEYDGPITVCPPAPATGDFFTIEDITLAAGGPAPKPQRRRTRAHNADPDRLAAQLQGDKFYLGPPCQRCGGTQRYVSNGACVACVRAASRRRKRKGA